MKSHPQSEVDLCSALPLARLARPRLLVGMYWTVIREGGIEEV